MTHFLSDVINPVGAITGIDPVKQATGFTGTGFQAKPQAQGSSSQQAASSSGGGGGGSNPSVAGNMLSQLVGQQMQSPQSQLMQPQFSVAQPNQPWSGFGQQLSQLGSPQSMQSSMNVAGQTFNRWFGGMQ